MARRAKRNGGREPLGLLGVAGFAAAALGLIAVVWLAWAPCEAGECLAQDRIAASGATTPEETRSHPHRRARDDAGAAASASDTAEAAEPIVVARVEAAPSESAPPIDQTGPAEAAVPGAPEIHAADAEPKHDQDGSQASDAAVIAAAVPPASSEAQADTAEEAAEVASPSAETAAAADSAKEALAAAAEPPKDEPQAAPTAETSPKNEASRGEGAATGAAASADNAPDEQPPDANAAKEQAAQSTDKKRASEEVKKSEAAAAAAEAAARKAESAAAEVAVRKAESAAAEEAARKADAARNSETVVAMVTPPAGSGKDLSGIWELSNAIDTTTYLPYLGLRVGYRVRLEQKGSKLVGTGEKFSENGRMLPPGERTPISLEGTVVGQTVMLNFTERYNGGSTGGTMSWKTVPRGRMDGRFSSNAAKSSGISSARRLAAGASR